MTVHTETKGNVGVSNTGVDGAGIMRQRFGDLWRHPDFLRLWSAQTISVFGSQITALALALVAALTLNATPTQMGLLVAAQTAPMLLVGLFAGVWVDRVRRRPILIVGDLGRGALLLTIPALSLRGLLRIEHLYAVGFLTGMLTVFFQVAYQSYLPSLVGRQHLIEGNSKLETSGSAASVAGPGIAGWLVQAMTAPLALVVDAISFFLSGLLLGLIRTPEADPHPSEQRQGIWCEIGQGITLVIGNPLLRATAGCTATMNLSGSLASAVYVLYVTGDLGLGPGVLGLIAAGGNVGVLAGALLIGWITDRVTIGRLILVLPAVSASGALLLPLAGGPTFALVALLMVGGAVTGVSSLIFNVNAVSLRQALTPERIQGRMNATMRFINWSTLPVGALLGGFLGERIGLWPTLVLAASGQLLSVPWIWFSPVRSLRTIPEVSQVPATLQAS